MTELYLISTDEVQKLPAAYCAARFPERTARAGRYVRGEDTLRCLGAGALLSSVLGIEEKDLTENEYHKPLCPACAKQFNLSHSGKYALLATDDVPVGADIEALDRRHIDLAGHVFTSEEQQWMATDAEVRFFILWTLKESVMKQCGRGFYLQPQSFSVLPLIRGESITVACGDAGASPDAAAVNNTAVYAKTLTYDGYIIAVCAAHPIGEVTIKTLTAEELLTTKK